MLKKKKRIGKPVLLTGGDWEGLTVGCRGNLGRHCTLTICGWASVMVWMVVLGKTLKGKRENLSSTGL